MVSGLASGSVIRFGRERLISCSILVLVVWLGNFLEFDRFSLYADDWRYLGWEVGDPSAAIGWLDGFEQYPVARLGQWSLIYLEGRLVAWFGTLAAAYLFLFFISVLSVLATWRVLTIRFSDRVALAAAIVLAISPLVSIRPFLNAVASPASLLLLMIAGALWVSDRKICSYLVALLVLSTYELIFPLFVFLPILLKPIATRRDVFRFIGHALICAALLAADAGMIALYRGDRLRAGIGGQDGIDLAWGMLRVMVRSLQSGLSGSVNVGSWLGKLHGMADVQLWGVIAFAAFAFLLWRPEPVRPAAGTGDRRLAAQTIAVLLLMALSGYALVYFASPLGAGGVLGRESRFHSAASLPLAILSGMILVGLTRIAQSGWGRVAVVAADAGYLAAMFAFSISHQSDFVLATERQRLVVAQLAIDHPMLDPHATFIIRFADVEKRDRQAIEYNDTHSWYRMLRMLFAFPDGPQSGPVIRIVREDSWPHYLAPGPDGRLDWTGLVFPLEPEQAGHIWYYDLTLDGVLKPVGTPILVGGRNILHAGPDAPDGAVNLGRLAKLPLFGMVMGPDAAILETVAGGREGSGAAEP
jgi:hypothetical protein